MLPVVYIHLMILSFLSHFLSQKHVRWPRFFICDRDKKSDSVTPPTRLFKKLLLPGNFIMVSITLDGKLTIRPYTPITGNDELGYMDLMIKVYSEGKVSSYMDSLAIGDQIMIRGPVGKIRYHGKGKNFRLKYQLC